MKIIFIISVFILQQGFALLGQTTVGADIDADLSLVSNLKVYALSSFDERNTTHIGSPFLFEDWQNANIRLNKRKAFINDSFLLNYDLESGTFLVQTEVDMLYLPTAILDRVVVTNTDNSTEEYVIFDQDLYKIVADGETKLLVKTDLELIKANYNVALDTGNLRPKYVQSSKMFIFKEGNIYELPKKRKQLKKAFKKIPEVADILLDDKVDLKDEAEVTSAILKLNNKI